MTARILGATSFSSLKNIDGEYLQDGDLSILLGDSGVTFYKLQVGSTVDEDIPYVLTPNQNPENKRWYIISITELTEDVKLNKDNSLEISNIRIGEDNVLRIYDQQYNKVAQIENNFITFNKPLYVDNIYIEKINDINADKILFTDASRSLTSPIVSPDPLYPGHLTNKNYVDGLNTTITDSLESYKGFVDNNFAKWDNVEVHIPAGDYNPTTKKYVDDNFVSTETWVNDNFGFTISDNDVLTLHNPNDINFGSNLSVIDDVDGTVTINVPNDLTVISNYDTGDLTEGTNLYYTDYRVEAKVNNLLNANDSITLTYSSEFNTLVIGENHSSTTNNPHNVNATDVGAIVSIDGVSNSGGDVDLINGGNVTIIPDDATNTITLSVPNDLTVMNNYELNDLNNVSASPSAEQVLTYNSTSGNWEAADTSNVENINQLTDVDTSVVTNEQVLTYNSTSGNWEPADASGGSGLPQLNPDDWSLDDTDTGSSRGNAFSMIESIDFASGVDGAAWITFHFPSSLDASTDISLDLYYNLSGSNDSTTISLQTDYWAFTDNETPSVGVPDGTNSDSVSTGIGQDGQRQSISLTSIPNTAIATGDTIVLKVTRLGSADTYTGTLQLLYIFPSQV